MREGGGKEQDWERHKVPGSEERMNERMNDTLIIKQLSACMHYGTRIAHGVDLSTIE